MNVVEKLLAREAPLNWRNIGYYGRTALHAACLNNKPDVVKVLTQQDDINVQVQDTILKLTPLHYACWVGHLKCVQLLMATGQCDLGKSGYACVGHVQVKLIPKTATQLVT